MYYFEGILIKKSNNEVFSLAIFSPNAYASVVDTVQVLKPIQFVNCNNFNVTKTLEITKEGGL